MTLTDAYPMCLRPRTEGKGQGDAQGSREGREGRPLLRRPRHFRRRASAVIVTPSRVSQTRIDKMSPQDEPHSPRQETGGRRARAVSPMLSPSSPWWSDLRCCPAATELSQFGEKRQSSQRVGDRQLRHVVGPLKPNLQVSPAISALRRVLL